MTNFRSHRLSTVTHADQILVLSGGKVEESGTHQELLAKKGKYATMWKRQIKAERAVKVASKAMAEAKALAEAAMERPSSSGNDGLPSEDVSENEAEARLGNPTSAVPNLASEALVRSAGNLEQGGLPEPASATGSSIIGGSSDAKFDEGNLDDQGDGRSSHGS